MTIGPDEIEAELQKILSITILGLFAGTTWELAVVALHSAAWRFAYDHELPVPNVKHTDDILSIEQQVALNTHVVRCVITRPSWMPVARIAIVRSATIENQHWRTAYGTWTPDQDYTTATDDW